MTRTAVTVAGIVFIFSAAAISQPVTFESPCSCHGNHGEHRWSVKNDAETPPTDASAIQAVTPSDMASWPGADGQLPWHSERTGRANNWYSVTGRVVAVKIEGADEKLTLLRKRLANRVASR
jgi:hypothetical protein